MDPCLRALRAQAIPSLLLAECPLVAVLQHHPMPPALRGRLHRRPLLLRLLSALRDAWHLCGVNISNVVEPAAPRLGSASASEQSWLQERAPLRQHRPQKAFLQKPCITLCRRDPVTLRVSEEFLPQLHIVVSEEFFYPPLDLLRQASPGNPQLKCLCKLFLQEPLVASGRAVPPGFVPPFFQLCQTHLGLSLQGHRRLSWPPPQVGWCAEWCGGSILDSGKAGRPEGRVAWLGSFGSLLYLLVLAFLTDL